MTSDDDRPRTATGSLDLSSLMGDGADGAHGVGGAGAADAADGGDGALDGDEADERTIVIGGLDEADERTLLVNDTLVVDETIVMDAEATIVADRGWGVPPVGGVGGGEVVPGTARSVGLGGAPPSGAEVPGLPVAGSGSGSGAGDARDAPLGSADPGALGPRRSRRTAAQLARVELPSGLVEAPSAEGAGVGARDAYMPRPVPTPPIVPTLPPGGEATRAAAPSMPSVARSARRAGRLALILAAAAVVVTIGGLVLIVAAFLTP